jgi:hypothetical protein
MMMPIFCSYYSLFSMYRAAAVWGWWLIQVYVHRSGRTARANSSGTAISLVAPEDHSYHSLICEHLGVFPNNKMPALKIDLSVLPAIRERIKLAKQVLALLSLSVSAKIDYHIVLHFPKSGLIIDFHAFVCGFPSNP